VQYRDENKAVLETALEKGGADIRQKNALLAKKSVLLVRTDDRVAVSMG
jgi:hypothetical protein